MTADKRMRLKTRNTMDNFNAEADIVSNFLNLNLELESKTTIANVMTAIDVRKRGEN